MNAEVNNCSLSACSLMHDGRLAVLAVVAVGQAAERKAGGEWCW